jgi:hypothetical protein
MSFLITRRPFIDFVDTRDAECVSCIAVKEQCEIMTNGCEALRGDGMFNPNYLRFRLDSHGSSRTAGSRGKKDIEFKSGSYRRARSCEYKRACQTDVASYSFA